RDQSFLGGKTPCPDREPGPGPQPDPRLGTFFGAWRLFVVAWWPAVRVPATAFSVRVATATVAAGVGVRGCAAVARLGAWRPGQGRVTPRERGRLCLVPLRDLRAVVQRVLTPCPPTVPGELARALALDPVVLILGLLRRLGGDGRLCGRGRLARGRRRVLAVVR